MEEINETAFSQILLKKGLLAMADLQHSLQLQKSYGERGEEKPLERILVEERLVGEDDIVRIKNSIILGKEIDLPGFMLIKKIGEGGMGAVYKGVQLSLERMIAIKLLDTELGKNKNFLQRFIQEARALAQLNHRNIVKGIDFGESNGTYYYVMEYLSGRNMQDIVDSKGPLKEKTVLAILMQMAQALEYIQQQQLIHRDIKPENILLCRDGTAKLCDLGLAKWQKFSLSLTTEGAIVGTPYYLSPEQAQGKTDIDIRSDIYSLGASAYFLLTGKPPYQGEKATVIHFRHIYDPPPKVTEERFDLSPRWDKFFARIMAKDLDKRIQNPGKLLQTIANLSMPQAVSTEKKPNLQKKPESSRAGVKNLKTKKEVEPKLQKKSTRKAKNRANDQKGIQSTSQAPASVAVPLSRRRGKNCPLTEAPKTMSKKQKLLMGILITFMSILALAVGIGVRVLISK